MSASGIPTLEALHEAGVLRLVDIHFAKRLAKIVAHEDDGMVLFALAVEVN